MIAKALNIDGLNVLFHFIFIPNCILKIKWKLLNLCLIVYYIGMFYIDMYNYEFVYSINFLSNCYQKSLDEILWKKLMKGKE